MPNDMTPHRPESASEWLMRVGPIAARINAEFRLSDACEAGAVVTAAMVRACIDPAEVRERAALIDVPVSLMKPRCCVCQERFEPSDLATHEPWCDERAGRERAEERDRKRFEMRGGM